MATVAAVVYEHHEKNDGTFNIKIRVYHKSQKKYIDTTHYVSRRQLDAEYNIKDRYLTRVLDETLDEYREAITQLGGKVDFFTCEGLRDYLQNMNSEIFAVNYWENISYIQINSWRPGSCHDDRANKSDIKNAIKSLAGCLIQAGNRFCCMCGKPGLRIRFSHLSMR